MGMGAIGSGSSSAAAMQAVANQAEADQLQAAKDMNKAKKDTYIKATIQARN